jgi:mono/diheme cytochrome c family protein
LFLFAYAALVAGCEAPPSASTLHEWTPADHDRAEEAARAQQGQTGVKGGSDALLEASWAQQCAACHGPIGHGDGPTGPMVHAADLTLADWQATVTDAQIAGVIVNGKGKMPPFGNLPPKIIAGLVARIRASRGR